MIGPFVKKYTTVKRLFLYNQVAACLCLTLVCFTKYFDLHLYLVGCMVLFIISYQISQGSFFFVYTASVGTETHNSLGVGAIFGFAFLVSLTTGTLISWLQFIPFFGLTAVLMIVGFFFFWRMMKCT